MIVKRKTEIFVNSFQSNSFQNPFPCSRSTETERKQVFKKNKMKTKEGAVAQPLDQNETRFHFDRLVFLDYNHKFSTDGIIFRFVQQANTFF